jgi:hypothetical protein
MRRNRIKRMQNAADALEGLGFHEEAFALRWIAYEGVLARASVKALWLRGARVADAETVINREPNLTPTTMVARAVGVKSQSVKAPTLSQMKNNREVRNLLFHQASVPEKRKMKVLSAYLKTFLQNPTTALSSLNVEVKSGTRSTFVSLGDPFVDLRSLRTKGFKRGTTRSAVSLFVSLDEDQ